MINGVEKYCSEMLSLMFGFGIISRLGSGWVADRIGGLSPRGEAQTEEYDGEKEYAQYMHGPFSVTST